MAKLRRVINRIEGGKCENLVFIEVSAFLDRKDFHIR
jgi:hypothetical protein